LSGHISTIGKLATFKLARGKWTKQNR
jgi:hypothetical protein